VLHVLPLTKEVIKMRYQIFPIILILALSIIGCDINNVIKNDTYATPYSTTKSAKGVFRLVIDNVDGDIEIKTHRANDIKIEAEIHVTASSMEAAKDFAKEVDIDVFKEDDALHVETFFPYPKPSKIGEVGVDYYIRVPKDLDIEASNTNGDIILEDIHGNLKISTTNGDITADNVFGDVDATNANGKIDLIEIDGSVDASSTNGKLAISVVAIKVNCKARTTNGDIILYMPKDASTQGTARTSNGKIESEFRGDHSRSRERLELMLNDGEGELELWTTNGDIKLLILD